LQAKPPDATISLVALGALVSPCLVSTLDAYFRGKKKLFEGLAMEKLEKNWTKHPVLHLDLNTSTYDSKEALIKKLEQALDNWQEEYGVQRDNYTSDLRFENLVMRIRKITEP